MTTENYCTLEGSFGEHSPAGLLLKCYHEEKFCEMEVSCSHHRNRLHHHSEVASIGEMEEARLVSLVNAS